MDSMIQQFSSIAASDQLAADRAAVLHTVVEFIQLL